LGLGCCAALSAVGWVETLIRTAHCRRPRALDLDTPITCDEFPFFATHQAVDLTLPDRSLVADVRLTPLAESSVQGNDTATFYRQCLDNTSGERFIVLPVPSWVAAGGPSFGFKVNQGGAGLCMKPRVTTP
jgi:hypothetical protein